MTFYTHILLSNTAWQMTSRQSPTHKSKLNFPQPQALAARRQNEDAIPYNKYKLQERGHKK